MILRTLLLSLLAFILLIVPVRAQDTVVFEKDIEYTNPDNQHLQLNLARPSTGEGPFPAVLCIHGGGFRAGTRDGYDGLIKQLAARGYVAVTVSYRLAPKYPFCGGRRQDRRGLHRFVHDQYRPLPRRQQVARRQA